MPTIDDENSSASSEGIMDDPETGTSTSRNEKSSDKDEEERKIQLAKKESETILRLRLLVFIVHLLSSIAVSLTVYYISSGALEHEYESQYQAAAKKVAEAFMDIPASKISALASLGVAVIAHGLDHGQEWPFVTVSSFQQRASTACSQSGALDIQISPLVEEDERTAWELFVKEDIQWV